MVVFQEAGVGGTSNLPPSRESEAKDALTIRLGAADHFAGIAESGPKPTGCEERREGVAQS